MVVALGENRLEPSKGLKGCEINLIDLFQRRTNGSVDVEIAAGKNRMRVEEFLEDRKGPPTKLGQRFLERFGRCSRKTASQ